MQAAPARQSEVYPVLVDVLPAGLANAMCHLATPNHPIRWGGMDTHEKPNIDRLVQPFRRLIPVLE